jgi:hypothetical protein
MNHESQASHCPSAHTPHSVSRREFLARGSAAAAVSVLSGVTLPHVHAGEDNTIRLALIGCGGRGSGAAANAFESPNGPVKLVVMADLFADRLQKSHDVLKQKYAAQMDVPPNRRFVGFDAWRKAIDSLKSGDVAMLTGYSGFRPAQLEYAVAKGINVFMEKSFGPDAPALRRVIQAGEAAEKKNVKIAAERKGVSPTDWHISQRRECGQPYRAFSFAIDLVASSAPQAGAARQFAAQRPVILVRIHGCERIPRHRSVKRPDAPAWRCQRGVEPVTGGDHPEP